MAPVAIRDDTAQQKFEVPADAFRVLITGFGPFMQYQDNHQENPSWLAVKPLQNTILQTNIHSNRHQVPPSTSTPGGATGTVGNQSQPTRSSNGVLNEYDLIQPRPIHITTLKVPVAYESVLKVIPGLHARPPVLPSDTPPESIPPPPTHYDFIFHIGVAGRGDLRMERLGHKLGYHMKDVTGKLAPIVRLSPKDFSRRGSGGSGAGTSSGPSVAASSSTTASSTSSTSLVGQNSSGPSAAEIMERERLGMDSVEGNDLIVRPIRGFGSGYESFSDEITTDIDVTRLVSDMKRSGEQIYSSMDAGHYLCDFIYYCSLAEKKRSSKPYEKKRMTQVLFLHCPPVNQPLSTRQVTDAIEKIVIWVCSEQQVEALKEDVGVAVTKIG